MNVIWKPPIAFDDLDELSELVAKDSPIVSAWDELSSGDWKSFYKDCIVHDDDYLVYLDSNVLSHLISMYDGAKPNMRMRQSAALMAISIVFDFKVNPTIASHEYALTGSNPPNQRLAAFYAIDNLHPALLSDYALGRVDSLCLIQRSDLPSSQHRGKLDVPITGHAFYRTCLLKVIALQTDNSFTGHKIKDRAKRYRALVDWMYYEFGFSNAVLAIANQFWGQRRGQSVLKISQTTDPDKLMAACENATWDVVVVESWSKSENDRNPGDRMNLLYTFDKALASVGRELLAKPRQGVDNTQEDAERILKTHWPARIAKELSQYVNNLQDKLDDPFEPINLRRRTYV